MMPDTVGWRYVTTTATASALSPVRSVRTLVRRAGRGRGAGVSSCLLFTLLAGRDGEEMVRMVVYGRKEEGRMYKPILVIVVVRGMRGWSSSSLLTLCHVHG
jgi:hypothetical protein